MKWADVTISVDGETLRGSAARSRINHDHPNTFSPLKQIVLLKLSGNKTAASNDIIRAWLDRHYPAPLAPVEPQPRSVAEVRRSAPNVVVRPICRLQLKMDVNRTGHVAGVPPGNQPWAWGPVPGTGHGAILMVRTRTYADAAQEVAERAPLDIAWETARSPNWQATLQVDHADRIRIYRTKRNDAELLLGKAYDAPFALAAGPLSLDADPAIKAELDAGNPVHLWIEAVDYPGTLDDADWEVTTTLTYVDIDSSPLPDHRTQVTRASTMRIAPWIMANDLDPTHRAYVANYADVDSIQFALAQRVAAWDARVRTDVEAGVNGKPFLRDVMKAGYSAAPHYSGVIVQDELDKGATPSTAMVSVAAAAAVNGGIIVKPPNPVNTAPLTAPIQDRIDAAYERMDSVVPLVVDLGKAALAQANRDMDALLVVRTSQDNGGNLVVSPRSLAYPYGRILFGASDNGGQNCRAEAFYRAQRMQGPIRLDSTWLRVGHVDEMLSFVTAGGRNFALLASARLAYIMLRCAASSQPFLDARDLIAWATARNDECIAAGQHRHEHVSARLAPLAAAVPDAVPAWALELVSAAQPLPAGIGDRFVAVRPDGAEVISQVAGLSKPNGATQAAFRAVRPLGSLNFELRAHAPYFVRNMKSVLTTSLDNWQRCLDATRVVLRNQLGFDDADIIDVPVIFGAELGLAVAWSGDSVNLLQVDLSPPVGQHPTSKCLVPKPFGPWYTDRYLFEDYLSQVFNRIGIVYQFAEDDNFHIQEGEIHCGTNQVPLALPEGRKEWWAADGPHD